MMLEEGVSLVIPAKNAARIIEEVLEAVLAMREAGELEEIIVVDDASTDATRNVVERYPVRLLDGGRRGPGGARNVGWRAAHHRLVWFIDSDCVASPGSLKKLLDEMEDSRVVGVGGGYSNLVPDSLVGCLIHEEMEIRNSKHACDASFLRGANVLFRRELLEELGGFDEKHLNGPGSPGAEDMEIGYRALEAGYKLRFVPDSRVGHDHPTRFWRYLRTQRHHGYWRVWLYARHSGWMRGDSYTGLLDHLQPPLAMSTLLLAPLVLSPDLRLWPVIGGLALLGLQVPMAGKLVAQTREKRYWAFIPFGAIRALARSLGMAWGMASVLLWMLGGSRDWEH
jgi:GT2 family glycosyltransferase